MLDPRTSRWTISSGPRGVPAPPPRRHFLVCSAPCREVARALLQRASSVGFCTRFDRVQRLRALTLTPQEPGVFCGARHPLYRRHEVDPDAPAASDAVGFEEDQMAGALSAWPCTGCATASAAARSPSRVVDLVQLLENGTALGCLSRSHAAKYRMRLWQVRVSGPPPLVDMFSPTDRERHITPVEAALKDHLKTRGSALPPRDGRRPLLATASGLKQPKHLVRETGAHRAVMKPTALCASLAGRKIAFCRPSAPSASPRRHCQVVWVDGQTAARDRAHHFDPSDPGRANMRRPPRRPRREPQNPARILIHANEGLDAGD